METSFKKKTGAKISPGLIKNNRFLLIGIILLLLGLLIFSVVIGVTFGPVKIKALEVWKIIVYNMFHIKMSGIQELTDGPKYQIIWNIRYPRVLLGVIVGAGLAIVGTAMQALVKNPLADPYILGISSGASVGATLVMLGGGISIFGIHSVEGAAFIGALLTSVLVYGLSRVGGRMTPVKLLLAGIAIGSICSSITSFLIYTARDAEGIKSVMFWLMGSMVGAEWEHLKLPAIAVVLGIILLTFMYRPLNVMLMGDETATTLGIDIEKYRKILMLLTSFLTGIIVCMVGCIGFFGLMVPHIVRFVVGSDHRKVLPISALVGSIFMLWTDVLARIVIAPSEMPIGVITSLFGAPFFLWLMCRNSYSFGGNDR